MEVDAPETIAASGGRYALRDNAETPDTLEVQYHYAKGFDMIWSQTDASSHGFDGKPLGITFQGTNGTLVAENRLQVRPGKRLRIRRQRLGRADADDRSAAVAAFGP